jgi:hypothetical protein
MPFEEKFLARWSRRKAKDYLPSGSVNPAPPAPRDPAPDMNSAQGSSAEPPPDVECASLDLSSDFSRFVGDGISDTVQTTALRWLWRTSPLIGASDGLDVYRADYACASRLRDASAAVSRAVLSVAARQCAADQPASSLTAPQNEVPSGAEEEKSQPPRAQEPQPKE